MIHCGNAGKEWKILHKRLQRIALDVYKRQVQ